MVDSISSPAVLVNNDNITIIPNSFTYRAGKGNKTVRTGSNGGSSTVKVISEDAEAKKGYVKFSVYPTSDQIDKIETWQDAVNNNVVQWIDSKTGFNKTMQQAIVINDPDINLSADGVIEIEFEGDTVV